MKLKIIFLLFLLISVYPAGHARKPDKKIKISGVVLDANKKPVKNVLIFVDKVKTNSVTDSKGIYKIKVQPSAKEISAFSLSNGAKEMQINGQTVINFVLDGISDNLIQPAPREREIINIGYGAVDRNTLTMPVNKFERKTNKYGSYINIFEMINGEVPGVEVSGNSIKIRNASSFQLSTEPLFVLDGIIVPKIDDISPSQVKSIEVLKGPSASIYGARGGNGVIVITLISGRDIK